MNDKIIYLECILEEKKETFEFGRKIERFKQIEHKPENIIFSSKLEETAGVVSRLKSVNRKLYENMDEKEIQESNINTVCGFYYFITSNNSVVLELDEEDYSKFKNLSTESIYFSTEIGLTGGLI